jgi:DHA2 family metal-tetracycline-proton antiporter-like MFS transporter
MTVKPFVPKLKGTRMSEHNECSVKPTIKLTRQGEQPGKSLSITLLLCSCAFFSTLNVTMFNVTIPDIAKQFQLSPTEVSWVLTIFTLIYGLGAVVYGKLADLYPIKRLITIGLLIFNLGSLVGFFSTSFPMLVAGRFLQGCGGAAIPSLGMVIAMRYTPVAIRGRVLAALVSTLACAGASGPVVGGYIAGNFHWRYLFLLSAITLLTLPFYHRILPDEKRREGSIDFLGGLLLCASVVAFLLFVTELNYWGLLAALALLSAFVLHIHRAEDPFIKPSLLRDKYYRNALLSLFLVMFTVYAMMFTLPLMLRQLNHLGTQAIGLVIFPGALTAAVLGFTSSKMAERQGSIRVVYVGLGFLLAGHLTLSCLIGAQPPFITLGLLLSYSGFAIIHTSLAKVVSLILPEGQSGVGMGMYNLTFCLSGSMGAAVVGRLLETFADSPPLNPFATAAGGVYSNVFLVLIGFVLCASGLFYHTFHRLRNRYKRYPLSE